MTSPHPDDDQALLARIREAVAGTAALRDTIRRAARSAYATRAGMPGRLLARLSYDSILEEPGPVRAIGSGDRRVVTFEAPMLSVEIEIGGDRLLGQVVPPSRAAVEMMSPDGPLGRTTADDRGCFVLPVPDPGPVRFGCRVDEGLVVTDWVRL